MFEGVGMNEQDRLCIDKLTEQLRKLTEELIRLQEAMTAPLTRVVADGRE